MSNLSLKGINSQPAGWYQQKITRNFRPKNLVNGPNIFGKKV